MKTKYTCSVLLFTLTLLCSACTPLLTPPALSPTPAPTATPEPSDPAAIVQAFWDAVNNKDLDTAMSLVSEDIQGVGPRMKFTGKNNYKSYL